jgi:protocatechuate 3,4-dioxygenase alpha subunit
MLAETASQTAGPYLHIGLAPQQAGFDIFEKNFDNVLVSPQSKGERIRVECRVFDGLRTPVRDALIEIWQANAAGRYAHLATSKTRPPIHTFMGGEEGCATSIPVSVPSIPSSPAVFGRNGRLMAPHINLWIVATGINIGLNTRMYFSDEEEANANDPVLNGIEWEVRHKTTYRPTRSKRQPGGISIRHLPARTRRNRVLRHLMHLLRRCS